MLFVLRQYVLPCSKEQGATGTCTIVNYKNEPVLITAKHVLGDGIVNGQEITLKLDHRYNPIYPTFRVKTPTTANVDLVLLYPIKETGASLPQSIINIDETNFSFSVSDFNREHILFGFPASIPNHTYFILTEWDYPYPSQKILTLSNLIKDDSDNVFHLFDGTASPGMSGGPIFIYNYEINQWKMVSILSGGIIDDYLKTDIDTSIYVGSGSGFCYGISPIYLFRD